MGFCEVLAELNRILTEMSLPNFTTIKGSTERMDQTSVQLGMEMLSEAEAERWGSAPLTHAGKGALTGQLRVLSEFPSL